MRTPVRTDLAIEEHEDYGGEGVDIKNIAAGRGVEVCELEVKTKDAAHRLSKPIGRYVTISALELMFDTDVYSKVCSVIAETIRSMADCDKAVLVAGLGNRDITPDALGPEVVDRVFVTNHIKQQLRYDFVEKFGNVCAIAPGVLGTTGMESSSIISAIVKEQKPAAVIAVDAYAARSISRISTTIQVSNTGLIPGGGVGNRRMAINEESLGVPTIAVGVPTVVDAGTIAAELSGNMGNQKSDNPSALVVTPRDIDLVIDRTSKTIANGINLAVHPRLTAEEIESYIG